MTTILFLCHGNICRSPMAEMIFRELVGRSGLDDRFCAVSAAVSTEETGNDIYPPAKRILRQKGIPFGLHRAHLVTKAEMESAALVIIMDEQNRRRLHYLFGNKFDAKTHLLMEYAGEKRSVADPWYTDDFEQAYRDIDTGCRGLLGSLTDAEWRKPSEMQSSSL